MYKEDKTPQDVTNQFIRDLESVMNTRISSIAITANGKYPRVTITSKTFLDLRPAKDSDEF